MKKTNNSIFYFPKSIVLTLFLLVFFTVTAQVSNRGNLAIFNNGTFYVKGAFVFGSTGLVKTSRTSGAYGKISFSPIATVSGVSGTQYTDGYVRKQGDSEYLFPIGQLRYAPLKIIPTIDSTIDAAYFAVDPNTLGIGLDASSVSYISTSEYWDISSPVSGTTSKISLTWRATTSGVQTIANGVFDDLVIVGLSNTTHNWEQIPSIIDVTSVLSETSSITGGGSITSFNDVVLDDYSAFTLGRNGICSILISASGATKTWNGSWDTGAPNLSDRAIINSAFSGPISCNSLQLNADLTLANGQLAEIVNGVTGVGKIIMANQASVVQRSTSLLKPTIELTKQSRPMRGFDYIYWGTPTVENVFSQLAEAKAQTGTLLGALDLKYYYQSGTGGGWRTLTATEPGKGFITRVKNQAPFDTFTSLQYDNINLKFSGTANNGDVSVGVTRNPTNINGGTSHNLLSNPYPCAIDGDKFLIGNPNLDGVIYVWQAVTQNPGTVLAYGQADYVAYTRAGFAAAAWATRDRFLGKIATGQGFLVKYLDVVSGVPTPTTGTVTFTNCMKMVANNTNFVRATDEAVIKDRYKLNMSGSNSVFSQILTAYLPECTYGYDRMYDAPRNSVSTAKLYSILETVGTKLAINARPSFVITDVVPLGVSKSTATAEDFTIGISEKEGVFDTGGISVFLHDNLLGTYHDFATGDYTFTADALAIDNRFEVVYQSPTVLNTPNFNVGQIIANISSNIITVSSTNEMKGIEIFDISGRKIQSFELNGATSMVKPFVFAEGIYIAKIKLENGALVSQKLINK